MPADQDSKMEDPAPESVPLLIHQGTTKIALAIVVAGAIIGWAVSGNDTEVPTYQGFAADGKIIRLNTDSGNIVACDFTKCVRILGNGPKIVKGSLEAGTERQVQEEVERRINQALAGPAGTAAKK